MIQFESMEAVIPEGGEETNHKDIMLDVPTNGNAKGNRVHDDVQESVGYEVATGAAKETTERKWCRFGCRYWCRKYFWEGQKLSTRQVSVSFLPPDASRTTRLFVRYRRLIGLLLPALFFHFWWWVLAIKFSYWPYFETRYKMCITMVFGSIIAGMTSEGGGAIIFPVMTLVLQVAPSVTRDFSLMIQSCGMTAAACTIMFMRVRVEWHSLVCCSLGGVAGIIFGLEIVDPRLTPQAKKMGFVSIWFAFASVLILLNRTAKRKTLDAVVDFNWWKALVLIGVGFLGGIFTAFSGRGIDICSFAFLTLLFRVSEKVATPTSIILMAGNSVVGFFWRGLFSSAISSEAWEYFAVCIPVVVIGAPLGSVIGSHFHRLVLAGMLILIDTVTLVSAFAIVKPMTDVLIGVSVGIIVGGIAFFIGILYAGERLVGKTLLHDRKVLPTMIVEKTPPGDLASDTSNGYMPSEIHETNGSTLNGGNINTGYVSEGDYSSRM